MLTMYLKQNVLHRFCFLWSWSAGEEVGKV